MTIPVSRYSPGVPRHSVARVARGRLREGRTFYCPPFRVREQYMAI